MIKFRNTEDQFFINAPSVVGAGASDLATLAPADAAVIVKERLFFDCQLVAGIFRMVGASVVGTSVIQTLKVQHGSADAGSTLISETGFVLKSTATTIARAAGAIFRVNGLGIGVAGLPVTVPAGNQINILYNTSGTLGGGTLGTFMFLGLLVKKIPNPNAPLG